MQSAGLLGVLTTVPNEAGPGLLAFLIDYRENMLLTERPGTCLPKAEFSKNACECALTENIAESVLSNPL